MRTGTTRPRYAARRDGTQDKGEQMEEQFERKFNKVSMVTLWIDPVESQIVRYDFENLGLDFLPGQWLVRVGETSASMTMGRYFDGVWLPKAIVMKGDLQAAIGTFDIDYRREFLEYRKAETSARIRGYGDVEMIDALLFALAIGSAAPGPAAQATAGQGSRLRRPRPRASGWSTSSSTATTRRRMPT